MYKIILICLLSLTAKNSFAFDFFHKPESRSHIYIVGSSTISPLTAAISEEFTRNQENKGNKVKLPLVESIGTSSGLKLFCAGVGLDYPDFVNASKPMESKDKELCKKNNVTDIVEIKIGYDGIVFANSITAKKINFTKKQIFLALAKVIYDEKSNKLIANPYKTWNQIDPKLPKTKITIYGPPLTSGTRDVFIDMLAMDELCFNNKNFIAAYPEYETRKKQCHELRNDEYFIETGENDNSIVQNLRDDKNAFGIIGFNFLIINKDKIQGSKIDNIECNSKNIALKQYPLSRPLFIYFKKQHLNLVKNIKEFVEEVVNKETIGTQGYLRHNGLVTMKDSELNEVRNNTLSDLN